MVKMALVNIALYCSKAGIRVPVVGWWWGGVVMQTDFRVKPTTQLLLGWVAVAWIGFGVMTIEHSLAILELLAQLKFGCSPDLIQQFSFILKV